MARASWKFCFFSKNIWRYLSNKRFLGSDYKLFLNKNLRYRLYKLALLRISKKYRTMVRIPSLIKKKKKWKNIFRYDFVRTVFYNTSTTLPKDFICQHLLLYKYFNPIMISMVPRMLGFRFGEFLVTRKPFVYTIKLKKKKKNIRR